MRCNLSKIKSDALLKYNHEKIRGRITYGLLFYLTMKFCYIQSKADFWLIFTRLIFGLFLLIRKGFMKIVTKHAKTGLLTSVILLSMNSANANNAEDRYIYIGTELGISEPVVKSFVDKDTDAKFRLKQSTMVGGRIGYSFYPNMMIELSATYQPKYGLTYLLPVKSTGINIPGIGAIDIPETPGRTKVSSNVYTANFIYEFSPVYAQVKPYVILGAGIARLSIIPN